MSQNLATKSTLSRAWAAVGVSAWVLLGLFGFTTAAFGILFMVLPENIGHYLATTTPGLFTLIAIQYVITLAVVVGIPMLVRSEREATDIKKLMGIVKPSHAGYVLAIPLVWLAYLFFSNLAVTLASMIPGFNADQTQDVGFSNLTNHGELALAFVALVILAPLAEELLFRGYLFGKLRAFSGFWPSAIVTSIVFGIAHQQWNVGVDVFVLSLFLCYLREKSGSIWPGIGLHAFKNSIAYFILFIGPLIGINLQ